MSRRFPRQRSIKLVLQEPVVRGKQIQIPIISNSPDASWSSWVDLNLCFRDAKLGNAIAEKIAQVLRDHAENIVEIRA